MNFNTAVSLDVIVSATGMLISVVGVYIKLKSKIDILEKEKEVMAKELGALHEKDKEIEREMLSLQKEVSQGHNKLETSMAQMELRIIREFQSVVTQIMNQKDK